MAAIATSLRHIAALTVLLLLTAVPASGAGRKVGGRTDIEDVGSNEEVQDLGRFTVDYYNTHLRRNGGAGDLIFSRVVEAQHQVVSGIKYYLRVAASEKDTGARRTFDAVVLVKPWLKSRDLLSFGPVAN